MARTPASRPTYYASRGGYYTWHEGRQVCCAVGPENDQKTIEQAWSRYNELKEQGQRYERKDENYLSTVFDIYLHHVKTRMKLKTFKHRQWFLQSFINWLAHSAKGLRVKDLTPGMVQDWIDLNRKPHSHPNYKKKLVSWGDTTERQAIDAIRSAISHARKMKLVDANPLEDMKKPRQKSRGKESLISEDQHKLIQAYCEQKNKKLGLYLSVLYETGARPGEIRNVTAAEMKEVDGILCFDLKDWKTKGKVKERVILIPDKLKDTIKALAELHPTGPLFRSARGNKTISENNLNNRLNRIRQVLGLPQQITAYSFRHGFATRWINQGRSIKLLAELMGTSVEMIEKHYFHKNVKELHRAMKEFAAG